MIFYNLLLIGISSWQQEIVTGARIFLLMMGHALLNSYPHTPENLRKLIMITIVALLPRSRMRSRGKVLVFICVCTYIWTKEKSERYLRAQFM